MKIIRLWWITQILFVLVLPRHSFATDLWPMYQTNPSHTGAIPVVLDPVNFSFLWQKTIASGSELSPAVAGDGKVFVSRRVYFSSGPSFFALDALTGDTLWTKEYPEAFSVNDPSYMDGRVYFQTCNHSTDTYLRVYDADTGALLLRTPHPAQWERYLAPTIYEGVIYVNAGYYGGMYAFDQTSGAQLWANTSLPQYDTWAPAVDETYAYAYLGEYEPGLYILDRSTGVTAFMIPDTQFSWNGWSMRQAPVLLSDGRVLAVNNGRLINFDTTTGSIAWVQTGGYLEQPVVSHGTIYAIKAGALAALDESTGALLWMWEPLLGQLTGPMIVTESHVFASTPTATYAIDITTRADVWNISSGGKLTIGNDHLYVAATSGTLTAISLTDIVPPPAPIALTVTPNIWTNVNSFSVNWTDPADPSGISGAYYKIGSVPISATDGTYTTNKPITVSATAEGMQTIYVWLKDGSGNATQINTSTATLYYDTTAPAGGSITATPGVGQMTLSWSGFADAMSGLRSTNRYKVVKSTSSYPSPQCTDGVQIYLNTGTSTTDTGIVKDTNYYYRICAYDNVGNVSAGSTVTATLPSLKILSPNGGEIFRAGSAIPVSWQKPINAASVSLSYSINGGAPIAIKLPKGFSGTSYNLVFKKAPTTNLDNVKVNMVAYSDAKAKIQIDSDVSDAPFSIYVHRLFAPNGGEALTSGSVFHVTWDTGTMKKAPATTELQYSVNGGTTWNTIVTLTGNPKAYDWTVPTVVTSTPCILRVLLKNSKGKNLLSDVSDAPFTIVP